MSALADELAAVQTMGRTELAQRWTDFFGRAPRPKTSNELMIMAVSYKIQEVALGGLRPAYRRRLRQAVDATRSTFTADTLRPGTLLVREWHGVTYSVTILDKGVQLQGRVYRSLTEVARFITRSHQSGPVFFGLHRKKASS